MANHADQPTNPDPANVASYKGPYVDPSLTDQDGPYNAGHTATDVPAKSDATTLGEIEVYNIPTVNHAPGDQGAVKPPHSPNSWLHGRDPYANNGMVGQDFLQNQG